MKSIQKQKKKIIICFTGEPRSFKKGLRSRNKVFNKKNIHKFEVETRYLMSFFNKNKKSNKSKILKRLKYFGQDKCLESIKLEPHKYENIWTNLISQKYEILSDLLKESKNIDQTIIVLTRTDWFFSKQSINLINIAIDRNKIILPFLMNQFSEFEGEKFKPMLDQYMVIPGNLAAKVIKALKISIKIASEYNNNSISRDLRLGGDGSNRYGITPENLLGLGFKLSKLDKQVRIIKNFEYEFEPDMYGTNPHNLIRDDAYIWMNLSLKDFATKYWLHLKSKIYKFLVISKILRSGK